jgi:hypothetical protein
VPLIGSAVQPIATSQSLRPKTVTPHGSGSVVVDFGQNFAGWVKLKTRGEAGRRITIRFAELLQPDGAVDQSNLRSARAMDSWVLRGDAAGESFEPHFTYHGFRYVQIDGLAGPLAPAMSRDRGAFQPARDRHAVAAALRAPAHVAERAVEPALELHGHPHRLPPAR